jgi:hypothetical protein
LSSLFSCLCVPVSFSLFLFTFFISLASFDILCVCVCVCVLSLSLELLHLFLFASFCIVCFVCKFVSLTFFWASSFFSLHHSIYCVCVSLFSTHFLQVSSRRRRKTHLLFIGLVWVYKGLIKQWCIRKIWWKVQWIG